MLMCPWITYLVADGLELSGIVAILLNGIFLNQYATPNISRASRKVIKITVETMAYVTETMVFIFLGMGVFAFTHPFKENIGTMICTLINLNLARFLNILIVTTLANKARSKETKFNFKTCFVMWVAGLRGAMAYALAISSATRFSARGSNAGHAILAVTLVYSIFTILGVSSVLHPIMSKCDVINAA